MSKLDGLDSVIVNLENLDGFPVVLTIGEGGKLTIIYDNRESSFTDEQIEKEATRVIKAELDKILG